MSILFYIKGHSTVSDLDTLTPADLPPLEDILSCLCHINRFNGMYGRLPVLAHCLQTLEIASSQTGGLTDIPSLMTTLTHDFQECITGDMPQPFKKILGENWRDLEIYLHKVFYNRLFPDSVYADLAIAVPYDRLCLLYEAQMLHIPLEIFKTDLFELDILNNPDRFNPALYDMSNQELIDLAKEKIMALNNSPGRCHYQ